MPAPASLRIARLSHRYPGADRRALDEVSFEVAPGERLGLLGPNGAGKSTLMRIVCGFLPIGREAEGAKVEVAGKDVVEDSLAVRKRVGYMPELVPLYPELRAREQLEFRARLKPVARAQVKREVGRVAELTGLAHVLEMPIGKLSRGYRQRVGLADALLGAPPLLVLDEPTVGLDPNQIREIRAMLREIGGAQTLVFSSHILAEVEALCDRVVILAGGKAVLDAKLGDALAAAHVELEIDGDADRLRTIVADAHAALALAVPDDVAIDPRDGHARVRLSLPAAIADVDLRAALGAACTKHAAIVRALVPGRTRLEERFAEV
ncbi:MAG TPA: ATP-binding cassette domain-containing protein, partial [Nannocystaceae bacterium]|nr:ATP-binding cassette domain-containing protein [Nannocystaceae bacterium]